MSQPQPPGPPIGPPPPSTPSPYQPYPTQPGPAAYPTYPSHPGYPGHPGGPGPQGPPPSKTLAGWALGLAIFPSVITWILAVVFAIRTLRTSKRTGLDHGRGMSIAALWVVAAWVALAVLVIVIAVAGRAERDEAGHVTDGGRVTVVDLRAGDCLPSADGLAGESKVFLEVVPCTEGHDGEVYANYDLDGEWTTQDEVDRISLAGCVDRFKEYVGVAPRKSELGILYFRPLSKTAFDRNSAVVCIVEAATALTTSLRGSGR